MPNSKFKQNLGPHLYTLADRLGDVRRIAPALKFIREQPGHAREVYVSYRQLIGRMAMLDINDIGRIESSQRKMKAKPDEQGSTSSVGANDIVKALGNSVNVLKEIAIQSVNPESRLYEPALLELQRRMEGGQSLELQGKTPMDGDPLSDRVIWGQTQIAGEEALLHFTVCHYLERYFAEALSRRNLAFAQEKDFFINALGDVVILDHLHGRGEESIYDMWTASKEAGGLGWIAQARLVSFN